MRWRCAQGHEWDASPYAIIKGHWCKRCFDSRVSALRMARSLARIQEVARSRGGECISEVYSEVDEPLRWRCAKGHEWESPIRYVRAGSWCPECQHEQSLRLTIDDMRAFAGTRGGECLSPAYRGPFVPLRWRCADGHEWDAPPNFVRIQGTWCPHCRKGPRKDADDVHAEAAAHGGALISEVFLGTMVPHRYRCRLGHEFTMLPAHVKSGHWCRRCNQAAAHDLARLREFVARRGGELLSTECGKSRARIRVRCREGHEWSTIQSSLMSGAWCRPCAAEARTGRPLRRLSLADMHETAAKLGGECVSDTYINSYTKLLWRCHEGHEWEATPNRIRSGAWCPTCSHGMRGSLDAMRNLAIERGGECISDTYENHKQRLRFRCSRGHVFTTRGTAVKSGIWCPICDPSHAPAATAVDGPTRRPRP